MNESPAWQTRLVRWRRGIPTEIGAAVDLDRGERPLAWTTDSAGRHIVATDRDLILQRNPPVYERIGWESIDQASYADGVLSLTLVPSNDEPAARLRIPVGDDTKLAVVIRDRVTSSIVVNQHMMLQGNKGLRVVARRRFGDPRLRWGYVADSGMTVDQTFRDAADDLVEQVQRESGLM